MFEAVETWDITIYFVFIGILLFFGKVIKEKVPFLNRIILPTALLGGFIGLIFSDGFIGMYTLDRAGVIREIVYHSLAIGFIAMTLKRTDNKTNRRIWSTGMIIVITYLLQAAVGVTVVYLLFKDIFDGAGLLLPLGFGQGPGLAANIGRSYELREISPLLYGEALGSTIASIGFLVGGVIGVIALNYLSRKNNLNINKFHQEESTVKEVFEFETIKEVRVFDALTTQAAIIALIYGAVYLTLVFLEGWFFPQLGELGVTFAGVFHGFNFLIGIIYALIFKKIITSMEKKGKNLTFMTNNYILSNISSLAFNFLIAAAVLSITISSIKEYYLLVIVLATTGTIVTFVFLKLIIKKVYDKEYEHHFFFGLFGMLTGTASTGLALLKGIDKDLESPVAEEMVLGSGTAISLALPLFALIMFPGLAIESGNNIFTILLFAIPIVYSLILIFIVLRINKK